MRLKLTTTKIVHLSLGEKNIYIKNNKLTFIFFIRCHWEQQQENSVIY